MEGISKNIALIFRSISCLSIEKDEPISRKLPKPEIYWKVANSYLSVRDMALFEMAIENKVIRKNYQFSIPKPIISDKISPPLSKNEHSQTPNTHEKASVEVILPNVNPYKEYLRISHSYQVELVSEDMRRWCEHRQIVMTNVKLRFIPLLKVSSHYGSEAVSQELIIVEEDDKLTLHQADDSTYLSPSKRPQKSIENSSPSLIENQLATENKASPIINNDLTLDHDVRLSVEKKEVDNLIEENSILMSPESFIPDIPRPPTNEDDMFERDTREWNLLHYITQLTFGNEYGVTSISWSCRDIFPQLHSLESLSCTHGAITSKEDVELLIHQCQINSRRDLSSSPGMHTLHSFRLLSSNYPSEFFSPIISKLPTIKTFHISSSKLNKSHLGAIGWNWPYLSDISIDGWLESKIHDKTLDQFYDQGNQQHFSCVKMIGCPKLTISGIIKFLFNSTETIRELRIDCYNEEELSWKLLPQCRNLELLDLSLSGHYSDKLLESLSKNCPKLKSINVIHAVHSHSFTHYGILILQQGCRNIEELLLGKCPGLSMLSLESIRHSFKNTIKKIFLVSNEIRLELRDLEHREFYFDDCRHRVQLTMEFS